MDPLFLINIIGAIHLVFSLNNGIIIHHMMTLLYYLMNGWVDRAIFGLDHSLARITEQVYVNGLT